MYTHTTAAAAGFTFTCARQAIAKHTEHREPKPRRATTLCVVRSRTENVQNMGDRTCETRFFLRDVFVGLFFGELRFETPIIILLENIVAFEYFVFTVNMSELASSNSYQFGTIDS